MFNCVDFLNLLISSNTIVFTLQPIANFVFLPEDTSNQLISILQAGTFTLYELSA